MRELEQETNECTHIGERHHLTNASLERYMSRKQQPANQGSCNEGIRSLGR